MNPNYTPDVGLALLAQGLFNYPVPAITGGTDVETVADMQGSNAPAAIGSVYFVPGGAVVASDTNYTTITVAKRTNGGAPTTIATLVTKITGGSGNLTAFKPVAMTVVPGAFLSAGDVVTVAATHTGTGLSIPQSQVCGFQAAA